MPEKSSSFVQGPLAWLQRTGLVTRIVIGLLAGGLLAAVAPRFVRQSVCQWSEGRGTDSGVITGDVGDCRPQARPEDQHSSVIDPLPVWDFQCGRRRRGGLFPVPVTPDAGDKSGSTDVTR